MKLVDYKNGAVVYFQAERAEKIFIVQAGYISLASTNIRGEAVQEVVKTGDFFGLKSALGGFPREETATAVSDSRVMVFTVPEFEKFCAANPNILVKMLKVFSNQLRQVNRELAQIRHSEAINADEGLYGVAEFYVKHGKYEQANFVLTKYMETYPDGKNAALAEQSLQDVKKMLEEKTE